MATLDPSGPVEAYAHASAVAGTGVASSHTSAPAANGRVRSGP
ncbi:hypothetical protein [Streptomyces sp. NPDC003943]